MEAKYIITQPEIAKLIGVKNQAIAMQATKLGVASTAIGNRTAYPPSAVRSLVEQRGFKYPHQVISFQMLKGGSSKTSSAFNLAVRLNQYGARVLVIDADAQSNISSALGHEITGQEIVLFHLLKREAHISEALVPVSQGLDLIASNFDNSAIDLVLQSQRSNLKKMIGELLEPIFDNYDFIIFDCNPALSALNISIALASDLVIVPVNPDPFSKSGLDKVLEEFQRMGSQYDKEINYKLLFTLHDAREATSRKYLIEYGSKYEDKMFACIIKRNADVKTSIDQKRCIFDLKKAASRPDFDAFALEVLEWPLTPVGVGNA
jgi:chromosome partitioning protein